MRHIAMYVCAAQQLLAHYCSLQRSRMKCKSMSIIALMTRSRIQIYIRDGYFKSSLYSSYHYECVCKAATTSSLFNIRLRVYVRQYTCLQHGRVFFKKIMRFLFKFITLFVISQCMCEHAAPSANY